MRRPAPLPPCNDTPQQNAETNTYPHGGLDGGARGLRVQDSPLCQHHVHVALDRPRRHIPRKELKLKITIWGRHVKAADSSDSQPQQSHCSLSSGKSDQHQTEGTHIHKEQHADTQTRRHRQAHHYTIPRARTNLSRLHAQKVMPASVGGGDSTSM